MSTSGGARVYRLEHRTEYTYDDDVATSYGRAHLIPRHGEGQQRLQHRILVEPQPDEVREHTDFFGNRSTYFAVNTPHRRLAVIAHSLVAVERPPVDRTALAALGWESVREVLAGPATLDGGSLDAGLVEARPFVLPSPLIAPDPGVTAFAGPLLRPGGTLAELLTGLVETIHDGFAYVAGATTVHTTLPEVLAHRKGVCQDFAHLAVAVLRGAGLAARYVSGYLETRPPEGRPRLQGADASHAWASVFVPGLGWVDLDPTNRQLVDDRYIVAAVGRDYGDVPPLRGVIFTESTESTMKVSVDVVPASSTEVADLAGMPGPGSG